MSRAIVVAALLGAWILASHVTALHSAGPASDDKVPVRDWQVVGPPEKSVDVLFVGDGYLAGDLKSKYWTDVDRCAKRFLDVMPFALFRKRINVRGALLASKERGCDSARDQDVVDTALDSSFDTKSGRLLAFRNDARLAEVVRDAGATDVVFVMVDTERFGGGGTVLSSIQVRGRDLPAPTYAAQDTTSFLIAVHELGHSFADLADEYVNEQDSHRYKLPTNGEDLSDANVTLSGHFDAATFAKLQTTVKWRHSLSLPGAKEREWLHEGGYYRAKGVWRPWKTCMMLEHGKPFCPVCDEEVARSIVACCGEEWDDAAWHKRRPLSEWR